MNFQRQWVASIYLRLMNGNFVNKAPQDGAAFVHYIRQVLAEIDDATLMSLLKSTDWRARLTAGWLIGFGRRGIFVDAVGENLMRFPRSADMYCFALARIGTTDAAPHLSHYLRANLTAGVAQDFNAEAFSVDYALAALRHLSPQAFARFYPDQWATFMQLNIDMYTDDLREKARARWDFDETQARFMEWMDYAEKHFD